MYKILSFITFALGLAFLGYFIGNALQFFTSGPLHAVTPKGLYQKTIVNTDTLKVEIHFWDTATEQNSLRCSAAEWEKTTKNHLQKAGFKVDEIVIYPAEIQELSKIIKDLDNNIIDQKKEFKLIQRIAAISKNLEIEKMIPKYMGDNSMNETKLASPL